MKLQDFGLLTIRLLSGGMMLTHGIPKFTLFLSILISGGGRFSLDHIRYFKAS